MFTISIIGNLGSDAVERKTANGKSIMTFSVAAQKGEKNVLWVNVVANLQDGLLPYLKKGKQVFVTGHGDVEMYKGTPDIKVSATYIALCGGKMDESDSNTPTVNEEEEKDNTY